MSGAYTRSGLVAGGHTVDQVARRAAAIDKIRELLAETPMTNVELAVKLNLPARTVYGYLCHLQDMGEAYQMEGTDGRGRKTWAMDDDAQQVATDRAQAEHARRAWVVPARQVGMQRHWMDVALFGPAQQGAAV
jgi:predicted ArsR family transcriptional regulator